MRAHVEISGDTAPVAHSDAQPRPRLERILRARRDRGHKLIVPYVTGGLGDDWPEIVASVAAAGADAVEIGIPFSDPVMDGPVIQEASRLALQAGTTPTQVMAQANRSGPGVPLVAMTYYTLVAHAGPVRFASQLAAGDISGAILPDLPLEEADPWSQAAQECGLATVMLVAPTTPLSRAEAICDMASGFVYGVGLMGVTGERKELAASALDVARKLKSITDLPVLIGVGVSTADHALQLCEVADGVIIGSALMRRVLAGEGPEAAADFIGEIRSALDAG